MQRQPYEPELMGATEAAQALGVRQTNLRTVKDFDHIVPYQVLAGGTLYRAAEIRELAYQRQQARKAPSTTTTKEADDECQSLQAAS